MEEFQIRKGKSEISSLVDKRVTAKLKKIKDKKAKEESAKEEFKAALVACLSKWDDSENPPKKKAKTVTISDTKTEIESVTLSALHGILKQVCNSNKT